MQIAVFILLTFLYQQILLMSMACAAGCFVAGMRRLVNASGAACRRGKY